MTSQEILQKCTVRGFVVHLPAIQLERKIYTDVAKALTLIGGKWTSGKTQGFVFNQDPSELLAQIAGGEKRNLKKEFQFFETPTDLADEMVERADIKAKHTILEPSAGQGAIIKSILRAVPAAKISYCETMEVNRTILKMFPSIVPLCPDFLHYDTVNFFDRIVANPPFSKNQDIDHIYHMYKVLKPGGRMVTIASYHWKFSDNKKEANFRQWIDQVSATITLIPSGTFKESGTNVQTVQIVIDK